MKAPQIIVTPSGEELVVLSRRDYEALVARSAPSEQEDAEAELKPEIVESLKALEEGREIVLPSEIATLLGRGENAIAVLREWRGLSQVQLARAAGMGQAHLSQIERGKAASASALRRIAQALGVPVDLLSA